MRTTKRTNSLTQTITALAAFTSIASCASPLAGNHPYTQTIESIHAAQRHEDITDVMVTHFDFDNDGDKDIIFTAKDGSYCFHEAVPAGKEVHRYPLEFGYEYDQNDSLFTHVPTNEEALKILEKMMRQNQDSTWTSWGVTWNYKAPIIRKEDRFIYIERGRTPQPGWIVPLTVKKHKDAYMGE